MRAPTKHRATALWGILLAVLGMSLIPSTVASADVNDFSYALWSSEYQISLDESGRAHAHVTETLVARFPDYDQNRGIVRGLTTEYLDANIHLRVLSITDEHGVPVPYTTQRADDMLYLYLGTDDYVHGPTTYVIEYEMRDIMLAATETQADEFNWNFLPLYSTQWIETFEGSVTFSPELTAQLTGNAACYEGYYGTSDRRCSLSGPVMIGQSARFDVSATDLPPTYGITVAVGFTQGTVTQPFSRVGSALTDEGPYWLLGGSALAATGGGIALAFSRRRARTATGIVVAQYEVPDDLPPLVAAPIYPGARNPIPAQMVHLAVRGVLHIESLSKKARPRLHLIDPDRTGDRLDGQMRDKIFTGTDTAVTLPSNSQSFANNMRSLTAAGVKAAIDRGLLVKRRSAGARLALWITLGMVGLSVLIAIVSAILGRPEAGTAIFITVGVGILVLIFALAFDTKHHMHTPKGAAAYEHLSGVREFIRVAEADRLRMLQSVTGAERYQAGSMEVVHLYERLLPYAMLFGNEKSWGRVLEVTYQSSQSSPVWLGTSNSFSFSSQLSSFSTTTRAASSYTPPSSGGSGSSFSGGSTGGGFSGGGGGGGFSGGR